MQNFKRVSFYFVAHADDWQLFMAPEIGNDIADKECKVVIVHTTAGDAGKDEKYWKAREAAAMESVLFMVSMDSSVHRSECIYYGGDGKQAQVFAINNCICFFLRLPDGGYYGKGFQKYNYQSIEKLRTGAIRHLSGTDTRSFYTSLQDLTDLIDNIIEKELPSSPDFTLAGVCLNFPEFDPELSPFDHNDHKNTALLLMGTKAYNLYQKRAFVGYHILHCAGLLAGDDLFWKTGMFCSYHQSLFREFGHSTLLEDPSFIPMSFRNSAYRYL